MYAVIFRARIKKLDEEYTSTAEALRQLAISDYGCRDFISFTEDNEEVAISWWDSLEQIKAWKENDSHKAAQKKGHSHWYEKVSVQVLELVREY